MATTSGRTAVFAADLARLKRQWTDKGSPPAGRGDSYQRVLRGKFRELADGQHGKLWYLPHWVLLHLLEGTPESLAQAKQAFLIEWAHGQELNRRAITGIRTSSASAIGGFARRCWRNC